MAGTDASRAVSAMTLGEDSDRTEAAKKELTEVASPVADRVKFGDADDGEGEDEDKFYDDDDDDDDDDDATPLGTGGRRQSVMDQHKAKRAQMKKAKQQLRDYKAEEKRKESLVAQQASRKPGTHRRSMSFEKLKANTMFASKGKLDEDAADMPPKKKSVLPSKPKLTSPISKILRKEKDEYSEETTSILPVIQDKSFDMTQPLARYFINSSHNSYLRGNQLTGKVTPKAVEKALVDGCRVIELDVWDSKSGPKVLHGGTLTRGHSFESFLSTINDHGFSTSPWPVIITLENHCNVENRNIMALLIKNVFGDKLYLPAADELTTPWPSPTDLKNKVVIRDKHAEDNPGKASSAALSDLIAIRNVKHHVALKSDHPTSSSQGEGKIKQMVSDRHKETVEHTRTHLLRTYPGGARVDSSNYNPASAWCAGAQVAALNWQTEAEPLWVNKAMFAMNSNAGYVLKPTSLTEDSMYHLDTVVQTLKVTVHSVRHADKQPGMLRRILPLWREDIYVRCHMFGGPSDMKVEHTEHHRIQKQYTYDEKFYFPMAHPNTAVLLFQCFDHDYASLDDYLGHIGVPLAALKDLPAGGATYVLPLHGKDGKLVSHRQTKDPNKSFSVVASFEWLDGEVHDDMTALSHKLEVLRKEMELLKAAKETGNGPGGSLWEENESLGDKSHFELMEEVLRLRAELAKFKNA